MGLPRRATSFTAGGSPKGKRMDFSNQWVEIFRAGDYGAKGAWTPEDIAAMVRNFDPATWQPPAVFGHPEHDAPAMGWVKELRAEGGRLLARFEKVHPALESSVQEGRYPNRSAAFYLDPEGKGPMLRHVGFLGATPPEIKGLAPIRFSDERFVAIEFQEERMDSVDRIIAEAMRPLRQQLEELESRVSRFAESARTATVDTREQKRPSVLMGEIHVNPTRGLRVVNMDLARRIEGIQLEAKKTGGILTWSEAREIAIAEGFKPE